MDINKGGLCLALLCFSLIACAGSKTMVACEFNNFVELDEKARRMVIIQCRPEQQIDLYLAWSSYTIPSNTDYADVIASTGKSLLPALLTRLEKSDHLSDEIKKPELLMVLDIMQRASYYSVAKDKNLMARVDKAVDKIPEESIRSWALDIVSKIKRDIIGSASILTD